MFDVAIIVVAYRSRADLPGLVASIPAAAGRLTWHTTIVNNTTDEPLADLFADDDRVTVVESGGNLGYSGGVNVGLRAHPPARWVVVLNPDLILEPGALVELDVVLRDGAAAVPRIADADGRPSLSLRREPTLLSALGTALAGDRVPSWAAALSETVRDPGDYDHRHAVDWATGAAVAMRSDVVETVGEWDAGRFFLYSEETDYCRRIREQAGDIVFAPAAVVRHRGGGSGTAPALDALQHVNKLRYYQKWHAPGASYAMALMLLLHAALRPHRAGSRAALRALVSRRARAALPGGPR